MNAKLVILKSGKPFFEYPIVVNSPTDFAEEARDVLAVFAEMHPTVSLVGASAEMADVLEAVSASCRGWRHEHPVKRRGANAADHRLACAAARLSAIVL